MPRASVYLMEGHAYHLTHRCHNRDHHLRFARDRDVYRRWLREGVKRFGVPVYAYCVTHNHVHIVAHVDNAEALSNFMHLVAGSTAKQYNLRKGHEGSVWEHPFHCTAVENGRHLLNCLVYVDLNMVRAGAVRHPREWAWCGHRELTGEQTRSRVLNQERLLKSLDVGTEAQFRKLYREALESRLALGPHRREPHWTEALAVGSEHYVDQAENWYPRRMRFEVMPVPSSTPPVWAIRESAPAYHVVSGPQNRQ